MFCLGCWLDVALTTRVLGRAAGGSVAGGSVAGGSVAGGSAAGGSVRGHGRVPALPAPGRTCHRGWGLFSGGTPVIIHKAL